MIITVTPNPTIDRVLFVNDFDLGDVVRAEGETVSPSGKAVDVAVVLHTFGVETVAFGLNAGLSGEMLAALLDEWETPYDFVQANGYTRIAALLTDKTAQRQSTIIAHTLTSEPAHLDELIVRVAAKMPQSWGMVCAGSVPPGMPQDAYARLISLAHEHNLTTLLDSSGESLRLGAAARPDVLKVNLSELAALLPKAAACWDVNNNEANVHDSASRMADELTRLMDQFTEQAIIVTLGRSGAVAVTPEGRWLVPALTVPWVSPAGAGDGMSSGIMLALYRNGSWKDALALGTAVAASVVMNPGTCESHPDQVEELLPKVQLRTI